MRDHPDFRNRLFDRTEEQMAALAFVCVPVRTGKDTDVIGTLSADTPLAPDGTLRLRCSFLESVAALVGKQVAYLQEEMARQHYQQSLEEPPLPPMPSIIGASKSIRQVLRQAMQVGPSRATALLRGESGTGKELMAEAIHRSSPRRNKPFVTLNCAALPSELLEGELFGWRKGAFTSAVQNRKGLFEQADKGTLFLDEIGDLALSAQAKILRAIQDRQIQCLGSEHLITVDVRLICATNRPLEQLVEQGLFREDLYYRINVFPIVMPPPARAPGRHPAAGGTFPRSVQPRVRAGCPAYLHARIGTADAARVAGECARTEERHGARRPRMRRGGNPYLPSPASVAIGG